MCSEHVGGRAKERSRQIRVKPFKDRGKGLGARTGDQGQLRKAREGLFPGASGRVQSCPVFDLSLELFWF